MIPYFSIHQESLFKVLFFIVIAGLLVGFSVAGTGDAGKSESLHDGMTIMLDDVAGETDVVKSVPAGTCNAQGALIEPESKSPERTEAESSRDAVIAVGPATTETGRETFIESFDGASPTPEFEDGSFTGANNVEWHYVAARDTCDFPIDGPGLILLDASNQSRIYSESISGGISYFSVDYKRAFADEGERRLELLINDVSLAESADAAEFGEVYKFEVEDIEVSGEFELQLRHAGAGPVTIDNITWTTYSSEETDTSEPHIPAVFALHQNYPNPFNPYTTIEFSLPENMAVELEVFDITGRRVETLISGEKAEGYHKITWQAAGQSSGIYLYRLSAGENVSYRKMILLK